MNDMGFITDIIKYNVNNRHRKARGQKRNFDTVRLANIINGADVQERIKHGDMVGYFGHWPRQKLGMNPVEGGLVNGKPVYIEPAIRQVYLKASPNGEIEHKVEFLDTDAGKLALKLYKSLVGGFSTVIRFDSINGKDVPNLYGGVDFVFEPNFTKNRGHEVACDSVMMDNFAFDSVSEGFDDLSSYFDSISMHNAMLEMKDSELQAIIEENKRLINALDSCETENMELYSMLEKKNIDKSQVSFDGVRDTVLFSKSSKFDGADNFLDADLVGYEGDSQDTNGKIVINTPKIRTAFDMVIDSVTHKR